MRAAFHLGFAFLCSVALTSPVIAQPLSSVAKIYTCIDDAGRRLSADRPIPQCADREQRVLGASGVERNRLGPALTELEMSQRLELRRQEAAAQQRLQDQRRVDAALLARYPEIAVHDAARKKALLQVDDTSIVAKRKLQELSLTMQRVQQALKGYLNPLDVPAQLRETALEVEKALQNQNVILNVQEEEKKRIHQRFDRELQKLKVLWRSQENKNIAPTKERSDSF